MPTVWHKKDPNLPAEAVFVGRPSPWGNPYRIGRHSTRAEAIQKFREKVLRMPNAQRQHWLKFLRGKDLVCYCAPKPCHADVLLEFANAPD